eukprot:7448839-Heterocapsa_arctica.AAC.1
MYESHIFHPPIQEVPPETATAGEKEPKEADMESEKPLAGPADKEKPAETAQFAQEEMAEPVRLHRRRRRRASSDSGGGSNNGSSVGGMLSGTVK